MPRTNDAAIVRLFVPSLVRRLEERWPDVQVHLVEDADDRRLLGDIEAGRIDATFVVLPVREGPFAVAELLADPYVLVVAADHPLAAGGPVALGELRGLPPLTCSQSRAPENLLRAYGIAAQIRHRIDDNETLIGLVAAGVGAALVPRLLVDPMRGDVVARPLALAIPPRPIALATHRDRRPREPLVDLLRLAQEVCDELST